MPITETDTRFDGAFDAITCPVCGCDEFAELRFEGVYCADCNCEVSLRPTIGDPGFIADFDAGTCWTDTPDEQRFPEHDGPQRTAFAKYSGGPGSYYRMYLCLSAEHADDGDPEAVRAWFDQAEE